MDQYRVTIIMIITTCENILFLMVCIYRVLEVTRSVEANLEPSGSLHFPTKTVLIHQIGSLS